MENHLIERATSTDTALELISKEIDSHGFVPRLEEYGDDPKTYRCYLIDDSGSEVQTGAGKGTGKQSKTSALFETFEHHLQSSKIKIDGINRYSEIKWFAVEELAAVDRIGTEKPIELLSKNNIQGQMPCQKFTDLSGQKDIYYPLILTIPAYLDSPLEGDTFDYRIAAKYGSNNGAGIGVGFEEAAIHAINEALERDAQATHLLKTFMKSVPDRLRVVKRESLPERLNEIVNSIQDEFGTEICIIDITSDFNVPAFRVHFTIPNYPKPMFGMGASLSKEYALERALLEALQVGHIISHTKADHPFVIREKKGLERLEGLPKYHDCVTYNVDRLFSRDHYILVDYEDLMSHKVPERLSVYLKTLNALVENNGYQVYTSTHFESQNGIVALHVTIPGTEKFFLVESGEYVLPSLRGRQLLDWHTISSTVNSLVEI